MLTKIPRNIFQTWKTKDTIFTSWKENNPTFTYFLFDDADCNAFIQKHFDRRIYNAYCRIIPPALKADLWRYCILYVYGGVYIDIDTLCLNSIELFLNDTVEFITPIDLNNGPTHYNLFNAFIASVPKHPILWDCIQRIVYNVENNVVSTVSNLDFSGPGVLGKATNVYLQHPETASFLQGYHNHIYLLHFDCATELVSDEHNNILFQNKNGNKYIQDNYTGTDWGAYKTIVKPLPTIVTMFYNIRDDGYTKSRSASTYLELAQQFILTTGYPTIVFTDCNDIQSSDVIKVIHKPLKDTYFYQFKDRLTELQQIYPIYNGDLSHETPLYIILNNNKFDFMETAIEANPFNSTHFVWMDFGINHVALNCEEIHNWIHHIPDKIKQLCINPFIENVPPKEMFHNIYHHMAGGLFTGSKENMLLYSSLFKGVVKQMYDEEWYQLDEAVMTVVQWDHPDLFDLYYGDYAGIISNYLRPMHNIGMILQASRKYIDKGNNKMAFDILQWLSPYFETVVDEHVYDYISQHIIVDYYVNNKQLLVGELMDLLKYDEKMVELIKYNESNLQFYVKK